MKKIIAIAIAFSSISLAACANTTSTEAVSQSDVRFNAPRIERMAAGKDLQYKYWNSGKDDCDSRLMKESVLSNYEIHQYDKSSYIIRQNKCSNPESPMMYLLLGERQNVLLDTGAKSNDGGEELAHIVQKLIHQHGNSKALLVLHSHHHSDHTAGDEVFASLDNTRVVNADKQSFADFHKNDISTIAMGDRALTIIKTPGHQEEAIAVYDSKTQWLLTGDSFYPGVLYVKHWQDYKSSIAKLHAFAEKHPVSYILGSHVEMSSDAGKAYDIGSVYQAQEAPMTMTVDQLAELHQQLQRTGEQRLAGSAYIVQPMNGLQKSLSNIVRWAKN
ncbi:MBL fold metallo-hydrolase [Pseudoteredinibacter isoporae]|uniref:MBL fold metallo-hydrolase n=1 Tax=Pseudoteredinibacter isoporae TaxID=570281 RepID=UPI0031056BDC